jgi:hypothetical protein
MKNYGRLCWLGCVLGFPGLLLGTGCYNTPIATSEYAQGPAPLRMPSLETSGAACDCYEDSLTGGQVFKMYCSYCHNAPPLSERPFSNYQNVAAHMRVRANLTGKENAKLMEFLRRVHDIPATESHEVPSPKRMVFGQPIPELRQQQPKEGTDLPAGPRPGALDEASPGQPPPGNSPREAR